MANHYYTPSQTHSNIIHVATKRIISVSSYLPIEDYILIIMSWGESWNGPVNREGYECRERKNTFLNFLYLYPYNTKESSIKILISHSISPFIPFQIQQSFARLLTSWNLWPCDFIHTTMQNRTERSSETNYITVWHYLLGSRLQCRARGRGIVEGTGRAGCSALCRKLWRYWPIVLPSGCSCLPHSCG